MEEKLDQILDKVDSISKQHTRLTYVTEWVKIVGGVILGIGGFLTASLQYGYMQSELNITQQMRGHYRDMNERLKEENDGLSVKRDQLEADIAQQLISNQEAQAQFNEIQSKLRAAQDKLRSIEATVENKKARTALVDVRANLTHLDQKVVETSALLKAPRPPQMLSERPRIVYLHIARESQRDLAQAIQSGLAERGFNVARGIQDVSKTAARAPQTTEIRYFRRQQQHSANEILQILGREYGIENIRLAFIARSPDAARHGQIEIWFPDGL